MSASPPALDILYNVAWQPNLAISRLLDTFRPANAFNIASADNSKYCFLTIMASYGECRFSHRQHLARECR